MFPHYANMRCNWNKVWPSVPPKEDFGYKYMKPEAQKEFDEWYPTVVGKPWNQDYEILKYCGLCNPPSLTPFSFAVQDVVILMNGCLKYREEMMAEVGWCPFTVSSTIAGYTQFVLRADYLNAVDFPYLPEGLTLHIPFHTFLYSWIRKCSPVEARPLVHQVDGEGVS